MIDHELLLKKMQLEFGLQGNAEEWFRIYLFGRRQRVCVGQATSCWQTPRFGVPQGHSGAIDVHPFINDLPQAIRCGSINMYADDTLYTAAKIIEETIDMLRTDAQSNLDWYKQSRLIVNLRKTHFMVLGRKHRRKEIYEAKLVLHNTEFQPEKTVTHP